MPVPLAPQNPIASSPTFLSTSLPPTTSFQPSAAGSSTPAKAPSVAVVKPLPLPPSLTIPPLTPDARAHLRRILRTATDGQGLDNAWVAALEQGLLQLGEAVDRGEWLAALRKRGADEPNEEEDTKGKGKEEPEQLPEADTRDARLKKLLTAALSTTSAPPNANSHLLLALAPLPPASPLRDLDFEVIPAQIAISFQAAKYTFPSFEFEGQKYGEGGVILFGEDVDLNERELNVVGGSFTIRGASRTMYLGLMSALRLGVYAYLAIVLETLLMRDSGAALVYPEPAPEPNATSASAPATASALPREIVKNNRLRSKAASGVWSYLSKKTENIITRATHSSRASMDSSSPRYTAPGQQTGAISSFSKEDGVGRVQGKDGGDDKSFASTLRRIKDDNFILSTSPGVNFPPPPLIERLATREERSSSFGVGTTTSTASTTASATPFTLTGDEKSGLTSILGWQSSSGDNKSSAALPKGVEGFVRHQTLTVLYSVYLPPVTATGNDAIKPKKLSKDIKAKTRPTTPEATTTPTMLSNSAGQLEVPRPGLGTSSSMSAVPTITTASSSTSILSTSSITSKLPSLPLPSSALRSMRSAPPETQPPTASAIKPCVRGHWHTYRYFSKHPPPPKPDAKPATDDTNGKDKEPAKESKSQPHHHASMHEDNPHGLDPTLGDMVKRRCSKVVFDGPCPSGSTDCKKHAGEHEMQWVHGSVRVVAKVAKIAEKTPSEGWELVKSAPREKVDMRMSSADPAGVAIVPEVKLEGPTETKESVPEKGKDVEMWLSCATCHSQTDANAMSDGTFLFSFGKFLEALIYSPKLAVLSAPLCEHTTPPPSTSSSPQSALPESRFNIVRHFSHAGYVLSFAVFPVKEVFEVRVPRLQIGRMDVGRERRRRKRGGQESSSGTNTTNTTTTATMSSSSSVASTASNTLVSTRSAVPPSVASTTTSGSQTPTQRTIGLPDEGHEDEGGEEPTSGEAAKEELRLEITHWWKDLKAHLRLLEEYFNDTSGSWNKTLPPNPADLPPPPEEPEGEEGGDGQKKDEAEGEKKDGGEEANTEGDKTPRMPTTALPTPDSEHPPPTLETPAPKAKVQLLSFVKRSKSLKSNSSSSSASTPTPAPPVPLPKQPAVVPPVDRPASPPPAPPPAPERPILSSATSFNSTTSNGTMSTAPTSSTFTSSTESPTTPTNGAVSHILPKTPVELLQKLHRNFQSAENKLYTELAAAPDGHLNDVRRTFQSRAKAATKRLEAWKRKHAPALIEEAEAAKKNAAAKAKREKDATAESESATSTVAKFEATDPEWFGNGCHAIPGGDVLVREGEWGSIIAFTLSSRDYLAELVRMAGHNVPSTRPRATSAASDQTTATNTTDTSALDPDDDTMSEHWDEPEPFTAEISRKEHPKDASHILSLRDVLGNKRALDSSTLTSTFSSLGSSASKLVNLKPGQATTADGTGKPIPAAAFAKPAAELSMHVAGGDIIVPGPDSETLLLGVGASEGTVDTDVTPTPSHFSSAPSDLSTEASSATTSTIVSSPTSTDSSRIVDTMISRGGNSTILHGSESSSGSGDKTPTGPGTPPALPPKDLPPKDDPPPGAFSAVGSLTSSLANAMRYVLNVGPGGETDMKTASTLPAHIHGLLNMDSPAIDPRPHIKYQWTLGKRLKFSCTVYYAKQFDAMRRKCGVGEVLVNSLMRSENWAADGGKSKSNFWKTSDDRFIIKTLVNAWNVADLQVLIELAPSYFRYIDSTANKASVLAKLLGFYTVEIKNLETGHTQSKADLLVMENLFFDQNISRTFDLKGIQGRRVKASGGKKDAPERKTTLFDGEWIEGQHRAMMLVQPHSKRILQEAIHADAEFLAKSNIMDYSLLLGIDEERRQIACGLVDTIGSYTFAKTLEYKAKQNLPSGKEVTVIPPAEYEERFVNAMEMYFLACPDKWTKPLNEDIVPTHVVDLPSVL